MKKIQQYILDMQKVISRGSFGSTYVATNTETGQQVAIKVLHRKQCEQSPSFDAVIRQIMLMRNIRGTNILAVYDVIKTLHNFYIVSELCQQNLQRFMKLNPIISQQKAKSYLFQLVNGFLTFSREGMIHKNLKPSKILFKDGILKINGIRNLQQQAYTLRCAIIPTPLYTSLQLLQNKVYSSKCDIWSLGCIFYELLHAKYPWTANSIYQLIHKTKTQPIEINENLEQNTKDFLRKCLAVNQKQRISWNSLFLHPIFNNYFKQKVNSNFEFENKQKIIMNHIRFKINCSNINLDKILSTLGYNDGQSQLCLQQLYQVFKAVQNSIKQQDINYIYKKLGKENKKTIPFNEVIYLMNKYDIHLSKTTSTNKVIEQNKQQQVNKN